MTKVLSIQKTLAKNLIFTSNAKNLKLYFKHKVFSELSSLESIPFVKKSLSWFIFHRSPYKTEKLLKSSVEHTFKTNNKLVWHIFHRWPQKSKNV